MTNNMPTDKERPIDVTIDTQMLHVTLQDGRIISTPLNWYPRLANAPRDQLENYELGLTGIHWPSIDEDLSIAGMLRGNHPSQNEKLDESKIA